MKQKVFVYDPTASDKLSSVRGIGRYLQILKENFEGEFEFVSDLSSIIHHQESIFINPFLNFLQPPLTLRRIAKKQIAVIHDLIPLKYPSHYPAGIKGSLYIFLNKLTLKNYDLIITDSEASKLDIINILGIQENKIKVIYPCLPKSFLNQNDKSISNFKFQISNSFCLYVGDATWNKNLVNLAKAIKIADISIIFVGKVFKNTSISHPWHKELNEFMQLVKDDKRFVFPGFVADNELIKLYKQSLLMILPSRDEGFGFSYVESAQFGCPSLLSDISVLREVSDGKAIFFDQNNPEDIAEKIKMIYSKDLRNRISADAKKRSEFFSPEKFKKEFLEII
jgi:glycosyltransferase involved in cell wall biosynthesis